MFFRVTTNAIPSDARRCVYLKPDNWDDWFSFRTMFSVCVIDDNGGQHQIGSVKIGRFGLQPSREVSAGFRAPEIPSEFDQLDERHFSLGQGEDYYASLNNLTTDLRDQILNGLRDCAFDLEIFRAAQQEPSMTTSLLRNVSAGSVRGRFHRLTRGHAELTKFKFEFQLPPSDDGAAPPSLSFEVVPESEPPTNVHILIGRNGVGKTRAMRGLIKALLNRDDGSSEPGWVVQFLRDDPDENDFSRFFMESPEEDQFAGLVLVSFSAFDDFRLTAEAGDRIPVEQVGLRRHHAIDDIEQDGIKEPDDLAADFRHSLEQCRTGARAQRWLDAVAMLENDDLFAEADVRSLMMCPDDNWAELATGLFSRLSSGHAVVLLTITRLVELVDERTLVVIDEPEGHLHPPLLSAFIRCLSDLLVKRNGVAIVATHSPVVLQEVPRSCVWKLRRSGRVATVERPGVETFGENVGILTREVFGLEVTRSGFHRMLASVIADRQFSYDDVIERFGNQLGAEARAIVRALVLERDRDD